MARGDGLVAVYDVERPPEAEATHATASGSSGGGGGGKGGRDRKKGGGGGRGKAAAPPKQPEGGAGGGVARPPPPPAALLLGCGTGAAAGHGGSAAALAFAAPSQAGGPARALISGGADGRVIAWNWPAIVRVWEQRGDGGGDAGAGGVGATCAPGGGPPSPPPWAAPLASATLERARSVNWVCCGGAGPHAGSVFVASTLKAISVFRLT